MTFNEWVREVINPQATINGNAISLDDFSIDGMKEYFYPKTFTVNGVEYSWSYGSHKTKGKGMSYHMELWLYKTKKTNYIDTTKIATGEWTLGKTRKGLKMIYNTLYEDRACLA